MSRSLAGVLSAYRNKVCWSSGVLTLAPSAPSAQVPGTGPAAVPGGAVVLPAGVRAAGVELCAQAARLGGQQPQPGQAALLPLPGRTLLHRAAQDRSGWAAGPAAGTGARGQVSRPIPPARNTWG